MDDAALVGGFERVEHSDADFEKLIERNRLAVDAMLERDAFEQLHRDVGHAVVFIDVVYRADVGMIQRGRGLRFAAKSFEGGGIFGDVVREKLQGDEALQFCVFSAEDNARIKDLAARNQGGALSTAEREELRGYANAGCLLGILHAKARRALKKAPGK